MYANYEVLVNAFNQKIIDLSQAEIVLIKTSEAPKQAFEKFIIEQDQRHPMQLAILNDKFFKLQKLERDLTWKKHEAKIEKIYGNLN